MVGRGGPRDLAAIRDGIGTAAALAARLQRLPRECAELSGVLRALLAPDQALMRESMAVLADELPLFKRDCGFGGDGYDGALDEARSLRDEFAQGGGPVAGPLRRPHRHQVIGRYATTTCWAISLTSPRSMATSS